MKSLPQAAVSGVTALAAFVVPSRLYSLPNFENLGGFTVMGNFNPLHHRKNFLGAACVLLATILLALCLPLASRAQDTGYIGGTVTDKSGAAVVGAEVVITNAAGSLTRATTTNADGAYVLAALPGDTYNLAVTAKGFQKFTAQKIVLNVAEKARIDVPLTVGSINEEVVVTGESVAQVETTSSDLTSTITGKQIDQLVLNGRNFTQLVNLAPGVVNQTGQDEGTVGVYGNVAYSMNGGRTEYNNWELDGGDNMDNGSNATLNVYPNPEAIAEFKVLTSNYGAQYGRNGSGTVEVETKSGGTTFHGSAFEYLRNEFFNAKSWREGADPTAKKASYKKHDFGYTVGGPVFIPDHYNADKKKTFFFFSEEWRREKNPHTTGLVNVPSDAERTGNFSDVCPGSDCPTVANPTAVPISPVGQALLALIPARSPGLSNNGFPAVLQTVSLPETWREELVRIDHNITDNYRLTFRYIHDSWQTQTENALWGNGSSFEDINTNFVGPGTSFVARLNANISPTLLNEFVASYTADHIFLSALHNPPLPAGLPMGLLFNNGQGGKLPAISLGNNLSYGGSSLIPSLVTNSFPGATIGSSTEAGCLKGHLFNPAPRIGFAWDPKGDGKMAIRSGYGIFFEHTNGNEANTESLEGSAPYSLNASQFNINGYGNIGGGGLLFPLTVFSIPDKAIWPYVQQWHLDVQKELPGHFVATVSYVGSKGTHLTQQRDVNQIVPLASSDNPYISVGR